MYWSKEIGRWTENKLEGDLIPKIIIYRDGSKTEDVTVCGYCAYNNNQLLTTKQAKLLQENLIFQA